MKRFGTAAILAGGRSKRMGFDKQQIKINDEWLIDILYNQLSEIFERVIVISNSPKLYEERLYEVYSDTLKGGGPLGGIHRALMESDSRYVFMIACDMTRIDPGLIELMRKRLESDRYEACVVKIGRWIEPFHGFYSVNLIDQIEDQVRAKDFKITHCLDKFKIDMIPEKLVRVFTPDWNLFRNLNSRMDLDEYRRKLDEKKDDH